MFEISRYWSVDQVNVIKKYGVEMMMGNLTQYRAVARAQVEISRRFNVQRSWDSVRNKLRREFGLID